MKKSQEIKKKETTIEDGPVVVSLEQPNPKTNMIIGFVRKNVINVLTV